VLKGLGLETFGLGGPGLEGCGPGFGLKIIALTTSLLLVQCLKLSQNSNL